MCWPSETLADEAVNPLEIDQRIRVRLSGSRGFDSFKVLKTKIARLPTSCEKVGEKRCPSLL